MNIVAPYPSNIPLNTANVNTEAARRDNLQREIIPQPGKADSSAAESGLGSESDRVRNPGQSQTNLTYEKLNGLQQQAEGAINKDNGEDPSAGKQNAEDKQKQQSEQKQVEDLKERDTEVRRHEQAHASAGGQYAGAPSYEYKTGPDGRQYAVGGEVSIDISKEDTPEETLRKMQQVRAAALAPAEPSPQDMRVANEATQRASEARSEIAQEKADEAKAAYDRTFSPESVEQNQGPELDDIVQGNEGGAPSRSLKQDDPVAEAAGLEMSSADFKQQLASRSSEVNQRATRIADFYQHVSVPKEYGLDMSA